MDKLQLDELMAQLDSVSETIARIREMVPAEPEAEAEEELAEMPMEPEAEAEPMAASPDTKALKKAAAVAMLKKSL